MRLTENTKDAKTKQQVNIIIYILDSAGDACAVSKTFCNHTTHRLSITPSPRILINPSDGVRAGFKPIGPTAPIRPALGGVCL